MPHACRTMHAGRQQTCEQQPQVASKLSAAVVAGIKLVATRLYRLQDGYACQYCGSGKELTLDHVIPQVFWAVLGSILGSTGCRGGGR